jgi:hypothetical protein
MSPNYFRYVSTARNKELTEPLMNYISRRAEDFVDEHSGRMR